MLKKQIMWLAKDGIIILDLHNVIKTNYISYQIKGLFIIQFGNLEPIALQEHALPNLVIQEGFFTINIFGKLEVNMTSCSEVDEKTYEEEDKQGNFPSGDGQDLGCSRGHGSTSELGENLYPTR